MYCVKLHISRPTQIQHNLFRKLSNLGVELPGEHVLFGDSGHILEPLHQLLDPRVTEFDPKQTHRLKMNVYFFSRFITVITKIRRELISITQKS